MTDLRLNDKGDIVLSRGRIYPNLQIDFFVNRFPVYKIDFAAGQSGRRDVPEKALEIKFFTEKTPFLGKMKAECVTAIDEIRQRITVRLRTELGDIRKRMTVGSELYAYKQKDITDYSVRLAVKEIVESSVKDILEDPVVLIRKENGTGNFFCENLNVRILSRGEPVYEFDFSGNY